MNDKSFDVIVSGHLCLDLIPAMPTVPLQALASPGKLFESGPMTISTGGAVSNTGLALHRLGARVRLMASVGDDLIGGAITAFVRDRDPALTELISVKPGVASSYTIVLSPQNIDRIFLHCTGHNENFGLAEINFDELRRAKIFHLGYPTLLPRLYHDGAGELSEIYRRAQEIGVVTSLDSTLPDANTPSGQTDWRLILSRTLPYVDIFVPSIEEILYMLRHDDYQKWQNAILENLTRDYLRELADELIAMGVGIAGFKLGEMGFYLRTGNQPDFTRLQQLGIDLTAWTNAEVYHPAFAVQVAGTTGAGDAAYAALFVALLKGFSPEETARLANAVGSCCCEAPDATSGVQPYEAVKARLDAGWPTVQRRLSGF